MRTGGVCAGVGGRVWGLPPVRPFAIPPFRPSALLPQPFTYTNLNYPHSSTRARPWCTTRVGEQASSLREGVAGRYRGERELGPSGMTAVRSVLAPRGGFVRRSTRFQTLVENPA